jgi:hypothetical protein
MQLRATRLTAIASAVKRAFSPASLFANGEQGWWYDPSNFATLFQDSEGTTPVTAVEQPVGLQLDLSKGLVLGPEVVVNGTFTGDSSTGWTLPSGATIVDDKLALNIPTSNVSSVYSVIVGKTYSWEFTVSNYTSGSINFSFGGSTRASVTANGTYRGVAVGVSSTVSVRVLSTGSPVASIDNISVKELPGNHRFQTTSANRPVVSARVNLLTKTEQFNDVAWLKYNATVTANTTTAPDGTLTADTFALTSTVGAVYVSVTPLGVMTCAIRAKQNTNRYIALIVGDNILQQGYVVFDLQTGAVGQTGSGTQTTGVSGSISPAENGFFTCVISFTRTLVANFKIELAPALTGNLFDANGEIIGNTIGNSVYIWGADLRVSNIGVGLPAYQRVNTSTDYDSTGFPIYIKPNGSNQSMQTNSINFTATDKMTVWQGVRKLSNAARGTLTELSTSSANPGSFALEAPTAALNDYAFISTGSVSATVIAAPYIAPTTTVITGVSSISTDVATIRINGAEVATNTANQGTGNYGNYPAYFYSRNGTGRFFNGNDYGSIARGAASTAAQIAAGETYINKLTKAF